MMIRQIFYFFTGLIALPLHATTFDLPDQQTRVVGHNLIVYSHKEDTLLDIARNFDLGYNDIVFANPKLDPWIPGDDQPVVVPTQFILPDAAHKGIVINLAEMRLYYYPKTAKNKPQQVITHPLGIGREGWSTPLGKARIIQKKKDPTWTPPASIRAEHLKKGDPLPKVVPAGPDNPLGAYAMRLSIPGYLLHGTNKPFGVGLRVSHGCIRLFPEDIKHLFGITPINTAVNIVYQPYKAAMKEGQLYLEAAQTQADTDHRSGNNMTPMVAAILKAQGSILLDKDWPYAEKLVRQHEGVVKKLHQSSLVVAKNLWFIGAGLQVGTREKMLQAMTTLKLDDYYWPQQNAGAQELLLGPFDSKDAADKAGQQMSRIADIPVWTVSLPTDTL